jgi:hypothetical protein
MIREGADESPWLEFEGGIAFGQSRGGFERGSGRDGEITVDFAAESVETGFEDFWFLGRVKEASPRRDYCVAKNAAFAPQEAPLGMTIESLRQGRFLWPPALDQRLRAEG